MFGDSDNEERPIERIASRKLKLCATLHLKGNVRCILVVQSVHLFTKTVLSSVEKPSAGKTAPTQWQEPRLNEVIPGTHQIETRIFSAKWFNHHRAPEMPGSSAKPHLDLDGSMNGFQNVDAVLRDRWATVWPIALWATVGRQTLWKNSRSPFENASSGSMETVLVKTALMPAEFYLSQFSRRDRRIPSDWPFQTSNPTSFPSSVSTWPRSPIHIFLANHRRPWRQFLYSSQIIVNPKILPFDLTGCARPISPIHLHFKIADT
jgi:hypothetical protein